MPMTHSREKSAQPGQRGAVPQAASRGRQGSTELDAGPARRWCSPAREAREGFLAAAARGVPRGLGWELEQVVAELAAASARRLSARFYSSAHFRGVQALWPWTPPFSPLGACVITSLEEWPSGDLVR